MKIYENTVEKLDLLAKSSKEKALQLKDTVKSSLEHVIKAVVNLKSEAKTVGEQGCIDVQASNLVKTIGEFYKSPPTDAKNIQEAVQSSKWTIENIKNRIIEQDLEVEINKLQECLNEKTVEECKTMFQEAMDNVITYAQEQFDHVYSTTGEIIDNSIELVNNWLKSHDLDILDTVNKIVAKAQVCLQGKNKDDVVETKDKVEL